MFLLSSSLFFFFDFSEKLTKIFVITNEQAGLLTLYALTKHKEELSGTHSNKMT